MSERGKANLTTCTTTKARKEKMFHGKSKEEKRKRRDAKETRGRREAGCGMREREGGERRCAARPHIEAGVATVETTETGRDNSPDRMGGGGAL